VRLYELLKEYDRHLMNAIKIFDEEVPPRGGDDALPTHAV